jgi:hypothetical protein
MPTTYDWPIALCPATLDWGLVWPQRMGRSAFDGSAQAQTLGPPRWTATMTTGPLPRAELPLWEALVDKLDGAVNRIRIWDHRRPGAVGLSLGTPVVRVASTGTSVATEGWVANVTGIRKAGDYVGIGINGELKRLVADVNSDALGRATLHFRPPLRAAADVGMPLVLVRPTARFMMTTERPDFRQEGGRVAGATLSFEEDTSA